MPAGLPPPHTRRRVGEDVLCRPLPVDAFPERRAGFVQDIDAIGFGGCPSDGDQNTFAGYNTMHVVGMFGLNCSVCHRWEQNGKSLGALLAGC